MPAAVRGSLYRAVTLGAIAVLVAACGVRLPLSLPQVPKILDEGRPPLLEGLGDLDYPIQTNSPLVQRLFNQGLTLAYAFNHEEAERSFREAGRLDDACAICFWGAALVLGPNINDPVPSPEREERAYALLQEALARIENAAANERALIEALAARYAAEAPDDRAGLDLAYADAMASVAERFPGDVDIQTLYAEALMDTMPWDYWLDGGEPKPATRTVLSVLEGVQEKMPDHPGANHFYIHAVEAAHPRRGIDAADRLGDVVPGAGHLVHMPSQIYIRVGRYHDGSTANEKAIEADQAYVAQCRAQGVYPLTYVPHNHHFLWATTTIEGRSRDAIAAARATAGQVDRKKMRDPAFGTLQHFYSIPMYALVRFGKWDDILSEPQPGKDLVYPTAIWHYVRGIAYARTGRSEEANSELERVLQIGQDESLDELRIWGVNATAKLVAIAGHVLAGEIAAAEEDYAIALEHLDQAVGIEDALVYGEPPDWFFPVRHTLGAILLEAGRPGEAESVFLEDLDKFPENGWALFGLAESLTAQGRTSEAARTRERFEKAWAFADVTLPGARF